MTAEKSAAEVWDEAIAAAAKDLDDAREAGGAYGQSQRRPSNFARAARYISSGVPNPYKDSGIPARESEQWKALCVSAENLGRAVAEFQNAKDDYTVLYPRRD